MTEQRVLTTIILVPTQIEIVDIAGLVKGASKGEGLGNKFLGNIRECNALLHVLRCFDDDNVVHVDGNVNPVRDKEIIDTELQFKDLESVDKTNISIALNHKSRINFEGSRFPYF